MVAAPWVGRTRRRPAPAARDTARQGQFAAAPAQGRPLAGDESHVTRLRRWDRSLNLVILRVDLLKRWSRNGQRGAREQDTGQSQDCQAGEEIPIVLH